MSKKKIYISSPITGHNLNERREFFARIDNSRLQASQSYEQAIARVCAVHGTHERRLTPAPWLRWHRCSEPMALLERL